MKVIDATNLKLGRMCSYVAKDALRGETIMIVNAENTVVTGTQPSILKRFAFLRDVGSRYKGPFYPKRADRIVKRSVRSMLPYTKKTGDDALRRVRVYMGVPEELAKAKLETIEGAKLGIVEKRLYMRLGDISKYLGVNQ